MHCNLFATIKPKLSFAAKHINLNLNNNIIRMVCLHFGMFAFCRLHSGFSLSFPPAVWHIIFNMCHLSDQHRSDIDNSCYSILIHHQKTLNSYYVWAYVLSSSASLSNLHQQMKLSHTTLQLEMIDWIITQLIICTEHLFYICPSDGAQSWTNSF